MSGVSNKDQGYLTHEDALHEWVERKTMDKIVQVCKRCGIIRRADDKNKPCKGIARVTTRQHHRRTPVA